MNFRRSKYTRYTFIYFLKNVPNISKKASDKIQVIILENNTKEERTGRKPKQQPKLAILLLHYTISPK